MWESIEAAGEDVLAKLEKVSTSALEKSANPDVYVPNEEFSNSIAVEKAKERRVSYSEAYYHLKMRLQFLRVRLGY
ncbi:hypothetical protein GN286_04135 [Rhodobacteraceae bacterium IMCC15231]|nr:hypothetical protein [Rhodobacteraceae bacterium IMCC15231]